jgi:hypothetical protein
MPRSLEKTLSELVRLAAPGELRLTVPVWARKLKQTEYTVSITTRGCHEGFGGATVAPAAETALGILTGPNPDIDPIVPRWYALGRMARQVVEQVLHRALAEHLERAALAKLAGTGDAHVEYEVADAFNAALDALHVDPLDPEGQLVPRQKLAALAVESSAQAGTSPNAAPRAAALAAPARKRAPIPARARNAARVSATLEALREKNRSARDEDRPGAASGGSEPARQRAKGRRPRLP